MRWRFVLACLSLMTSLVSLTSGADSNNTSVVTALNKISATINATNNQTLNYPYASNNSIILLGLLIILLLLFASAPILLNMYWSYKYLEKGQTLLKAMIDNSKDKPLDKDMIQTISSSLNAQPLGISGVGRSTMALTLVVVVGIGVFYVTLYPIDSQKSPLIKDLMLTLAGAISAIIGFYFGGRTGQEGSSATAPVATPATPQASDYTSSTTTPAVTPATPLAATSNLPPIMNSLTPDRPSPQPAGTTINWTAIATDPENDQVLYKFLLRGPSASDPIEKTGWITDNKWAWITPSTDTGTFQVEVWVRDGKHAGPESSDDKKMVEYTLTAAPKIG